MYPNPQDVLPLPRRPDLDQYKKRAKELVAAVNGGESGTLEWARQWVAALERVNPEPLRMNPRDRERRTRQVAAFAWHRVGEEKGGLAQAQFVLARAHGFPSWPAFVEQVRQLALIESESATFEAAADAIITGDLDALRRLIEAHPDLIKARSRRSHGATLLHYTAANGVENYRQRTPANIVEITRYLIDQGSDVNATADMYGGGADTFGLTISSAHPRLRGTQIAQADLLLSRGAVMGKDTIGVCLGNGCPEVAKHLAGLGAECNFVDAAGIGRTDLMERMFAERDRVPIKEPDGAMVSAAWYSEIDAVRWLLDHGFDVASKGGFDGQTALHVAAYQGNLPLTQLLLERGAPVNLPDEKWKTTPIIWAIHAWLEDERGGVEQYGPVIRLLVQHGAELSDELRNDPRVAAVLEAVD